MRDIGEKCRDGLFGLLVGDALGVPYEFHPPNRVPPTAKIEFAPPQGFARSHPGVPVGTWSDDGAQALCLLDSLTVCGRLDMDDFGARLVRWLDEGLWTPDGHVFDCGVQTMSALQTYASGTPPERSGLVVPDGKGNGALMRVLPLALWHTGPDAELAQDAHRQSRITHGHICNGVCCALYCLWARGLLDGAPAMQAYQQAVSFLQAHYADQPAHRYELDCCTAEGTPAGTGYVVDSIRSARYLLERHRRYEDVVKGAVALGNDTDTTAAIAGGLAGVAFGGIPDRWIEGLRGAEKAAQLIDRLQADRAVAP